MRKDLALLTVLVLAAVVVTSGCVSKVMDIIPGGECEEIEKGMQENENVDCDCYPTGFVPDDLKNKTGIEGKCYCTCKTVQGNESKIAVMENQDGQTIVSTIKSNSS